MRTDDYDFHLPPHLIAQRPAEQRDMARLLILSRDAGVQHGRFADLPSFLGPGDLVILNKSRVFPARLEVRKATGGTMRILLVKEISPGVWEILCRGRHTGIVSTGQGTSARIEDGRTIRFSPEIPVHDILWREGTIPLPPYIRRPPDEGDSDRYQTVYAGPEGSVAAPTAGLHFTQDLLCRIRAAGVLVRFVTLHVGPGTFRPVKAARLADHRMDAEWFEIDCGLPEEIRRVKASGGKVVTVGTTATRAVEGYWSGRCTITSSNGAIQGLTDVFIHEGFRFRAIDGLITNFHLPRSTPMMLAAAFAGRPALLDAYAVAVAMGYRFFSYGDAMLVL